MALIQKGFVSANEYNSLPTIQEAANFPRKYAADLGDLQQLLAKHDVPKSVSIRLIHRHYDIADGEAMVFRDVALPAYGTVEVMRARPIVSAQLHGKNFLVSSADQLQAYEYTADATIDISEYGTFVEEFVKVVAERKLHLKFGLKMNHRSKKDVRVNRKEFEFPEEQCTITIPINLPLPEATYEIDVVTDWGAVNIKHKSKWAGPNTQTNCSHGGDECSHSGFNCSHSRRNISSEDFQKECAKEDGMMFDGRIVQLGTPFYGLLNNLMEVW